MSHLQVCIICKLSRAVIAAAAAAFDHLDNSLQVLAMW